VLIAKKIPKIRVPAKDVKQGDSQFKIKNACLQDFAKE
jgi:hypothetical protein